MISWLLADLIADFDPCLGLHPTGMGIHSEDVDGVFRLLRASPPHEREIYGLPGGLVSSPSSKESIAG